VLTVFNFDAIRRPSRPSTWLDDPVVRSRFAAMLKLNAPFS